MLCFGSIMWAARFPLLCSGTHTIQQYYYSSTFWSKKPAELEHLLVPQEMKFRSASKAAAAASSPGFFFLSNSTSSIAQLVGIIVRETLMRLYCRTHHGRSSGTCPPSQKDCIVRHALGRHITTNANPKLHTPHGLPINVDLQYRHGGEHTSI